MDKKPVNTFMIIGLIGERMKQLRRVLEKNVNY
jgi:hypothetical protein